MKTITELRARLEEIQNELKGITDYSEEGVIDRVNALNNEFESVSAEIDAREKAESIVNKVGQSAGRKSKTPTETPKAGALPPRASENGLYGFESRGEFFGAVKNVAMQDKFDDRLKAAQQERVGSDGGFLIDEDFRGEIHKKFDSDESLMSRTRQFNVGGNRLSMPINELAPWSGQGSHITAFWTGEAKKYQDSKTEFGKLNIELEKLTALVYVTDEMLEDGPLIESYIQQETPEVLMQKVNEAIVSGDGVGKPQGYLNSSFGYQVAKEVGQAADTVVFNNLKKLYTHALPKAKRDGIFMYNVAVEEQLIGMKLEPTSTDSVSVYLPNNSIDGAPYGTLWGRPAFPMMGSMPQLGDKGDIVLADFSFYYVALKTAGIKQAVSTHVRFDTDETAYKFSIRMGGKTPFKDPANTQYGDYKLSGFTYLEDRA